MAFATMTLAFLVIAACVLGAVELLGMLVTTVSFIRRKKAKFTGKRPHKLGLVTGLVIMAVPVVIVGGVALYLFIGSLGESSYDRAIKYRDTLKAGIEKHDAYIIKGAFSSYVKAEDKELDEQIDELLDFIGEDVKEIKFILPKENCEEYADDGSFKLVTFRCETRELTTENGSFKLRLEGCSKHTDTKKHGIESITVKGGGKSLTIGIAAPNS